MLKSTGGTEGGSRFVKQVLRYLGIGALSFLVLTLSATKSRELALAPTRVKLNMSPLRLTQHGTHHAGIFHCWNCELIYNADFNSSINIGSRFMPKATTRRATDDSAYTGDEQAREIVACEPRSPNLFIYVKASEFILESACLAAV